MSTSTNVPYYVLYSSTSRDSSIGLRPRAALLRDNDIFAAADLYLKRIASSLLDLAGVEWRADLDGSVSQQCALSRDELLRLSVEILGDDGRLFLIFPANKDSEPAFLAAAETYGLTAVAQGIIDSFNFVSSN